MKRRSLATLATLALAAAPLAAEATADEPATPPAAATAAKAAPPPESAWQKWKDNLTLDGTVDFYIQHNFNDPDDNSVQIRAWDYNGIHKGPQLSLAKVTISHPADWFGFRVDLGYGSTMTAIGGTDPALADHGDYNAWHTPFEQAYLSVRIPVGRGLTVDVGKFVTHLGYEVIEDRDNWNYSRSILFNWAIPLYHTGVRLTYPITDTLSIMGEVTNGWNAFILGGTEMRSGGLQVLWTPKPQVTLSLNYYVGLTNALVNDPTTGEGDAVRNVIDFVGVFAPTSRLSLGVNADFGIDNGKKWGGAALYAKYQWLDWLASAVRGEYFDDSDGVNLLVPDMKTWEVTVTGLEFAGAVGKFQGTLRVEYRYDAANQDFFKSSGMTAAGTPPLVRQQHTLTVGTMLYF